MGGYEGFTTDFLGFSVGTWLVQQNGYTIPIPASPNPESHPTSRVFLEESRVPSPTNGRVFWLVGGYGDMGIYS
jgi:hypothetical protein